MNKTVSGYVDIISFRDKIIDAKQLLSQPRLNSLLCFENGYAIRFEDVYRKASCLNVYKGSFNPIHRAHETIAKIAEEREENSKSIFVLSRNTYDKGQIGVDDLYKRICQINERGYIVLVIDSGFFYDTIKEIGKRYSGKLIPIMGADTFNRFMNCYDVNDLSPLEKNIFEEHRRKEVMLNCSGIIKTDVEKECLKKTFCSCFSGINFLVFGRNIDVKIPEHISPSYGFLDFDMNISSSMIRAGEIKG